MKAIAGILASAFCVAALSCPALAQSATGGSGGSAATGGTSASTLGVGGTSTGSGQTSSAMGMGGSAAGPNAKSRAAVHGNRNLNGQAMAMAHDGGTFSKSHTVCHDKAGSSVSCRTKSMAHEPGSKPVMSTNSTSSGAQ